MVTMEPLSLISMVSAVLVIPALLLPIFGRRFKRVPSIAAILAVLVGMALLAGALPGISEAVAKPAGLFAIDWLGAVVMLAAMFSAIIVALASDNKEGSEIFSSMMLFSLTGTVLLATATDISVVIAGWALISVTGYALAAVMKDPGSLRNSIKYAIMGGIAAQFLIVAFTFLFITTGNFSLLPGLGNPYFVSASLIFLLVAVGFKTGAAPFHMWLPDVYGYASPIAVAALSSITKLGAIVVLVRATYYYLSSNAAYAQMAVAAMAIVATASMFIGNLGALTQKDVQRMMAYSSIAHIGYILIALAVIPVAIYVGETTSLYMAIAGLVIHVLAYSLAKAGVFTSIETFSGNGRPVIERFDGLGARDPGPAASISLLLLNLIGVPPLPGFWSKLLLFASAANPSLPGLVVSGVPWLTIIGVINSVISVFYYSRLLIAMYWRPSKFPKTFPISIKLAVMLSALLLLFIGIAAAPFLASVIM